jgi:hypothetical protein
MQYMILIYSEETTGQLSKEEEQAEFEGYMAWNAEMRQRGIMVAGDALHPASTATTLRVRDGKQHITDGPFAETKEVLGGYYVVDVKDLDEAIEVSAKLPHVKRGSVEIRPIVVF